MASTGVAKAITISYEAVNLTDTILGQDLWQYNYTVSDHTFSTHYGFTIYFDYELYESLVLGDSPPSVNGDWDLLVWQPELDFAGVQDPGAYDAIALEYNASLADLFSVRFVWLGSGAPGSQPFELYHDGTVFETISSSHSAPVPEPATIFLIGTGVVGMAGWKRTRDKQKI
jgi:hypothetical protein